MKLLYYNLIAVGAMLPITAELYFFWHFQSYKSNCTPVYRERLPIFFRFHCYCRPTKILYVTLNIQYTVNGMCGLTGQ